MNTPATQHTETTAALRRLAEAEEACPCGCELCRYVTDPDRHDDCKDCHGTGPVPFFRDAKDKALFRKVCPCIVAHRQSGHGGDFRLSDIVCLNCKIEHSALCEDCPGPGWLPLDLGEVHLETVEAACDGAGFALTIIYPGPDILVVDRRARRAVGECVRFIRSGANRVEAALLALDAAREARA